MRLVFFPLALLLACSGETEKTEGNSAPTIQSLTITGDTFSTSDTLTCAVQYVDADDDVVTETYEWTNQRGDLIGASNQVTLQVGVVEPLEMINCMVTLDDGMTSVSEIASATITNTPPTVDTVSIDPTEDITPESTLTCTATSSDPDGGAPDISYRWERNNTPLASTNTLSLPIVGDAAMGDTFVCIATALDTHGGEASNSASITVGNSPPSITDVQIVVANNPSLMFTSQLDVLCVANNVTDPNEDDVSLSYQWFVNGTLQTDAVTDTLSAPFTVGDEIGCQVTPNDGFDDGETVETTIVIPNSLPEIFSVEIDPNTDVEANSTLTCTVDAFDTDDGVLVGQYEWLDGDGNSAGTGGTLVLNPVTNRPEDEITCIARVSDNDGANAEFQSSVWVINTEPVVTNPASITSAPTPTSGGILTCSASFTDLNDGALTPTYTWALADGTPQSGNGSTYTINPAENNPTDTVVCTASATDTDGATVETTSSVVIENTDPTIDAFSISPSTSVEAIGTLEMIHSISDIDSEALTIEYAWIDDTGTVLGTNATLSIDNSRPVGSTITASITVTDGYGGTDIEVETVTIVNTPPVIDTPASISATPSEITTGVLTCSAAFSDYNDGSLTPSYVWTLADGTALPSVGNTLTIDANTTNPTDEIVCTAFTADNDGEQISSSASIIVQNTSPVVDSFVIAPGNSVEANVTLEMQYSVSDLDAENLTTTFEWSDASGILGTNDTLTLDNSRPVGSTITATITTTDGYGGTDTASESISIVNTDPVVDQPAAISSTPSPKTTGLLNCAASFSDYNDGPLSENYTWTHSDGTILAINSSLYTIDESETNPGDEIFCTAEATDNDGSSISSSASVVVENTDPNISAFTIAPDTSVEANATLEMQVSYTDIDNQGLNAVYEWRSVQGTLLGSTNLLPLNSSYAVGATIIASFTVTDVNGGSATQSDVVTILNTPPTISNPASISAAPSPTTTGVLTCSAAFSDYNDGSLTPSYVWTLTDGTPLAAVGNTLTIDANTTNPTDEIVCTAEATDNDGESISSSTSIVVQNTAPSIDGFTITPGSNVEANVTLEMMLSVSDLDNDTLSIQYSWLNNAGQTLGTGSTLTLDSSYAVGSTITALATLTDAYGANDTESAIVTIDNTLPEVVTPASISANPDAKTGNELTCSASFTDFNDGALSTSYAWTDGSTIVGTGSTYTIQSNDFSPTDLIYCTASATDNNGDTVQSTASVVLENTDPNITMTMIPGPVYDDGSISCFTGYEDVDSGENLTANFVWKVNGQNMSVNASSFNGPRSVGDMIECVLTVTDNYGGSDTSTGTNFVENRDPSIVSVSIPTSLNSYTDVTATVSAQDADNQNLTYTYEWYKEDASNGGTTVSIGSNSSTLPASQFDKHDIVYVLVTVSDGFASDTAASNSQLVPNTLPTAPGVSITPATTNVSIGTDLTCTVTTPSTDPDGDTVEYHFKWYNPSGILESDTVTTSTTDTYLGNNVDQIGTWTCEVTPSDDDGSGSSASATTVVLALESCLDYSNAGFTNDGVYTLYLVGVEIQAYCDMNTDGGGWTLFAVTGSSNCAENLSFGPNELTSVSASPYLTTLFKDAQHTEFLQDFRANGSITTFDIIYSFTNSKSVSQRFSTAESSGESVNWIVYFSTSSYLYSGTWWYSNNAGTSSKWNTSGSDFSNDDGIWGAQNGKLDGDSPGPYLSTGGWGHQNSNGSDSGCSTYYFNGTSSSSSNIQNLMYFR